MLNCAPVFLPVVHARGPTHRLFPGRLLTQMREAMPSTLSLYDFLAACQRPLRRSIRVKTLKISVADFLQLTAPYGWTLTPIPWCEEGFWIERDNEELSLFGKNICRAFKRPVLYSGKSQFNVARCRLVC